MDDIRKLIDKLNYVKNNYFYNFFPRDKRIAIKIINAAIEALQKQVPKKPIIEINNILLIKYIRCPICNTRIGDNDNLEGDISGFDYCPKCGQHIDWSMEE